LAEEKKERVRFMKNNLNRFGKKLLAFSLSMTIGLPAFLTGCGNNEAGELSEREGTESQTPADNGTSENIESSETDPAPVLTIWSNWSISDYFKDQGDAYYWKAIEEATGVDLQFIDCTGGKDTLSILVGTDDLPDIIIEYDGNLPGGVQKMMADGSILPLNNLMESGKLPNFTAYLESDPEADKLCKNDDGLYAWAPMIRKPDSPLVFNGNMIRQDWLDELGLTMPETVQEMEDVLLAFQNQKGCDIGFSFAYKNYDRMVNAFGICEGMYIGADDKVHFGAIENSYLDFLTLFNRWMQMGILDPDGFTQEIDAFYAKIASGRTGLVWGNTGGELGKIETMKAENPDMDFQPAPNPVLNKGDSFPVDQSNYRVSNIGYMISSTCSDMDAAARLIDYVYGEEGNMRANFGEEGITYELQDGKPVFTDLVLNNPEGLSIQRALSLYAGNNNKPFLVENEMMLGSYALDVQKKSLEVWATPDASVYKIPPLTLTTEEALEYNSLITDIQTYLDEFKLKFIMGTEPLDNYTQFVENINSMNIQRAIEIQQAAYERYLAR